MPIQIENKIYSAEYFKLLINNRMNDSTNIANYINNATSSELRLEKLNIIKVINLNNLVSNIKAKIKDDSSLKILSSIEYLNRNYFIAICYLLESGIIGTHDIDYFLSASSKDKKNILLNWLDDDININSGLIYSLSKIDTYDFNNLSINIKDDFFNFIYNNFVIGSLNREVINTLIKSEDILNFVSMAYSLSNSFQENRNYFLSEAVVSNTVEPNIMFNANTLAKLDIKNRASTSVSNHLLLFKLRYYSFISQYIAKYSVFTAYINFLNHLYNYDESIITDLHIDKNSMINEMMLYLLTKDQTSSGYENYVTTKFKAYAINDDSAASYTFNKMLRICYAAENSDVESLLLFKNNTMPSFISSAMESRSVLRDAEFYGQSFESTSPFIHISDVYIDDTYKIPFTHIYNKALDLLSSLIEACRPFLNNTNFTKVTPVPENYKQLLNIDINIKKDNNKYYITSMSDKIIEYIQENLGSQDIKSKIDTDFYYSNNENIDYLIDSQISNIPNSPFDLDLKSLIMRVLFIDLYVHYLLYIKDDSQTDTIFNFEISEYSYKLYKLVYLIRESIANSITFANNFTENIVDFKLSAPVPPPTEVSTSTNINSSHSSKFGLKINENIKIVDCSNTMPILTKSTLVLDKPTINQIKNIDKDIKMSFKGTIK